MKSHELYSVNIENIIIGRDALNALVSLLFCFSPTNREGHFFTPIVGTIKLRLKVFKELA